MDPYKHLTGLYTHIVDPVLKDIKEEGITLAKKYHLSDILDLGCGIGSQCIMLDKCGFRVEGVDYSEAMIRRARRYGPYIEYYVEDSSNTHFPDRSFDCVILCFALHENDAKERENIIKEVKRVLKEDGKFIITDFAYPRRPNSLRAKIGAFLSMIVERCGGGKHYKNYKDWMKNGALNVIESKFGFSVLERQRILFGIGEMVVAERPS